MLQHLTTEQSDNVLVTWTVSQHSLKLGSSYYQYDIFLTLSHLTRKGRRIKVHRAVKLFRMQSRGGRMAAGKTLAIQT